MCSGGGAKAPKVTAAPLAPPVVAPISADADAKKAGEEERRRRKAASGRSDTILTGGMGDVSAPQVGKKTLLGQ